MKKQRTAVSTNKKNQLTTREILKEERLKHLTQTSTYINVVEQCSKPATAPERLLF